MDEELIRKFRGGRPVDLAPLEAEQLREELRRAMAVALDRDPATIADEALVFDELGVDSIDVFDMLDQLAEALEITVEPDQISEEMIYGREGLTFRQFAEEIVAYFRSAPPEKEA